MKIVIAPDSFKGNMRALEVCEIIERGLTKVIPGCSCLKVPLADGGEGTTQAVVDATAGTMQSVEVEGPLGNTVTARYGLLPDGKTAVMEMAAASGLEMLSSDELDPMRTSTFGTGQMILDALHKGVDTIILGIGGSATVDGGAGMAQALGYTLLDSEGRDVARGGAGLGLITSVSAGSILPGIHEKLDKVKIKVACDVTNPLLGASGAAAVFGPQKGATPEMVVQLEAGLRNLSGIWKKEGMINSVDQPGDGAAGGLGAGLRAFLNAEIVSGAALVMEYAGFFKAMENADLVITGEGRTDSQTRGGKLCSVVAAESRKAGVPVILVSGALAGDLPAFYDDFHTAFSISSGQATLAEQIAGSKDDLYFTAMNIGKLLATDFGGK